jgi:hypothetical protein
VQHTTQQLCATAQIQLQHPDTDLAAAVLLPLAQRNGNAHPQVAAGG